jgi:hypothetical protein
MVMGSLNMSFKYLLTISENETATQNIWQHHFLLPGGEGGGGGEVLWDTFVARGSENSNTFGRNWMKIIDSSLHLTHIRTYESHS